MLALLIALLVCAEGAGIARAMSPGAMVHCCCGAHAIRRACKCPLCPIRLRREAQPHDDDRLSAPSSCVPSSDEGVLVVLATLSAPPRVRRDARARLLAFPSIVPPPSLLSAPHRPPP